MEYLVGNVDEIGKSVLVRGRDIVDDAGTRHEERHTLRIRRDELQRCEHFHLIRLA